MTRQPTGPNIAQTQSMLNAGELAQATGARPACVTPALEHNIGRHLSLADHPIAKICQAQVVPGALQVAYLPKSNPNGIGGIILGQLAQHITRDIPQGIADGIEPPQNGGFAVAEAEMPSAAPNTPGGAMPVESGRGVA